MRLILRSLGGVAAAGTAGGLLMAMMAARLLSALLYGITSTDATTYLAASVAFCALMMTTGIATIAAGSRIEPMQVLKEQ